MRESIIRGRKDRTGSVRERAGQLRAYAGNPVRTSAGNPIRAYISIPAGGYAGNSVRERAGQLRAYAGNSVRGYAGNPSGLREELAAARRELSAAYSSFNQTADPVLTEACIYRIRAETARCDWLFRAMKSCSEE